jgi:hypothetical protein
MAPAALDSPIAAMYFPLSFHGIANNVEELLITLEEGVKNLHNILRVGRSFVHMHRDARMRG